MQNSWGEIHKAHNTQYSNLSCPPLMTPVRMQDGFIAYYGIKMSLWKLVFYWMLWKGILTWKVNLLAGFFLPFFPLEKKVEKEGVNQKVFWIRLSIFARTILIKIRPCLTTMVGSSLKEKGNQHINGKRMLHTRIIARSLLLLRKVMPLHLHVVGWYCCMCMVGDFIDSRRIWCGWNVRYVQFYQVMFGILLYIFYSVIH